MDGNVDDMADLLGPEPSNTHPGEIAGVFTDWMDPIESRLLALECSLADLERAAACSPKPEELTEDMELRVAQVKREMVESFDAKMGERGRYGVRNCRGVMIGGLCATEEMRQGMEASMLLKADVAKVDLLEEALKLKADGTKMDELEEALKLKADSTKTDMLEGRVDELEGLKQRLTEAEKGLNDTNASLAAAVSTSAPCTGLRAERVSQAGSRGLMGAGESRGLCGGHGARG